MEDAKKHGAKEDYCRFGRCKDKETWEDIIDNWGGSSWERKTSDWNINNKHTKLPWADIHQSYIKGVSNIFHPDIRIKK